MSNQLSSIQDISRYSYAVPAFTKETLRKQLNLFSQLPESERSKFLDDLFFHGRQVVLIIPTDDGVVKRVDESAKDLQACSEETFLSQVKDNPDLLVNYPKKASDQEFMLNALALNGRVFQYLPQNLRQEENFFLKALEIDPSGQCLEFADKDLRLDIVFLSKALENKPQAYITIKSWLQASPHLAETLYNSIIENLLSLCKDHKNFSVKQKNLACDLYPICIDLKQIAKIEELYLSKVIKLGHKITKRLMNSEELVLKMLSSNYKLGQSVSSDLLNSSAFFEKAVLINPLVVTYLSSDMEQGIWTNSFENLLNKLEELIKHPSSTIDELINYYVNVNTYIQYANEFLDQKLGEDRFTQIEKEIINKITDPKKLITLLKDNKSLIKIIPLSLFENLDLMAQIARIDFDKLRKHPFYIPYLASNIEFWDKALKYNERLSTNVEFYYAPNEFKENPAIIKRLVKNDSRIIQDIDPDLKTKEFALECFEINPSSISYFNFKDIDDLFIEKASSINPSAIIYFNRERDLELIKKLIVNVPQVSAHLQHLCRDVNFALELCKINPACLEHLEKSLTQISYLELLETFNQQTKVS